MGLYIYCKLNRKTYAQTFPHTQTHYHDKMIIYNFQVSVSVAVEGRLPLRVCHTFQQMSIGSNRLVD